MLIAAAGLAGAGKTTTLKFLTEQLHGKLVYAGGYVQAEVAKRGLAVTPTNERLVREDLRSRNGMAAIAELAVPKIEENLKLGHVLIDAICNFEERDLYLSTFGTQLLLIGLDAPLHIRIERLSARSERPITETEISERDSYEMSQLRIDEVVSSADERIDNSGSIKALEKTLLRVARAVT